MPSPMASRVVAAVAVLAASATAAVTSRSSKRGLCYVPNAEWPEDNQVWVQSGSDLTWYYNYQDMPSAAYADKPQSEFEFVPMMWGVDTANLDSTAFYDAVRGLIDDGTNITHVLGFNEPDGDHGTGGSNTPPASAARAWVANFEPLGEMGVKLGLPAMTGGWGGMPWLKQFLGNCSELVTTDDDNPKNCTFDFVPVHWYDNFAGLQSHIGERHAAWPDADIWVTEYAYAHRTVPEAQGFYTQSAAWMDEQSYVARYSYFGAFRSQVSNVGPDVVFLNRDGELTDIGAWYLGLDVDGADPQSGEGDSAASTTCMPGVGLAVAVAAVLTMGLL